MNTFEDLERLNAQVDIWIDEEEYERVRQALPIADGGLRKSVKSCFADEKCTQGQESKWQTILPRDLPLPVKKARPTGRKENDISLNERWSSLFYAKLLRARIQQKGTDCYTRRLDEVVAYLENHLPAIRDEDSAKPTELTELTILYLLELAAASQSFETLGFAERARRVMEGRKGMLGKGAEEFNWFYDLFVRYNMGVGHFHTGRYRRAIMEFNGIIEQVQREGGKSAKLDFFKSRHGYRLLYLPAVIYRADVQLRLQLAYHALDTIDRYLRTQEKIGVYKKVRVHLIETEAYQQMGRLGETESWKHLSSAYNRLLDLRKSPLEKLEERTAFKPLPDILFDGHHQTIKGQCLHFFIEDYLEWLKQTLQTQTGAQDQRTQCFKMLCGMFDPNYFQIVQFHTRSRNGYYQQLAKFLAWLAHSKETKLRDMAKKLYSDRGRGMLRKPKDSECRLCTNEGADLKSMNPQYYSWFKDYVLKFFEDLQTSPGGNKEPEQSMELELKKFVKVFIERERKREDLRIADLGLRYELKSARDQMEKSYECPARRLFPALGGLLGGAVSNKQSEVRRDLMQLNSEEYLRIMTQWDEGFLRRLQSGSNQGGHRRGLYLIGLRRWNSSSPAQGRSVGGGYLLYHTDRYGTVDLGIAIDPGFDFVRNLFHEGFSISDIDIVLISHSHVDHVRDFESIVQLLAELKIRSKTNRRVHVMLSLGVYERLKHIIEDPFYRYHVEPYIIDACREIEPDYFENLSPDCDIRFVKRNGKGKPKQGMMRYRAVLPGNDSASQRDDPQITVMVQPTRAYHRDPSDYSDSFGFKIEVTEPDESTDGRAKAPSHHTTLGYTGDTKWVYPCIHPIVEGKDKGHKISDISKQYSDCDAVIVHLGSLVKKDEEGRLGKKFMNCSECDAKQQEECRDTVCEKDHPYLVGMIRLLSSLHSASRARMKGGSKLKQLVLVSEFGEELRGGIRVNLIERLRPAYKKALSFLPLDVGIDVQLLPRQKGNEQKAWCIQCERFVAIDDAEFERYGVDEALFCVCHTCKKATPLNVIQDRMRQLYEVGRDLRTLDE